MDEHRLTLIPPRDGLLGQIGEYELEVGVVGWSGLIDEPYLVAESPGWHVLTSDPAEGDDHVGVGRLEGDQPGEVSEGDSGVLGQGDVDRVGAVAVGVEVSEAGRLRPPGAVVAAPGSENG